MTLSDGTLLILRFYLPYSSVPSKIEATLADPCCLAFASGRCKSCSNEPPLRVQFECDHGNRK